MRILVVDDEASIRKDLLEVFAFEGISTLEAANGQAALELAQQYLPDAILCDVSMPGMDGFELFQALHANPATATIRFILLTAHAEAFLREKGMSLGVDDYLLKPFTLAELFNAIHRLET